MMLFIALLLLACFQGLSAVQWTSAYQNTSKICPGRNLTLGWDYTLEPGETVESTKWFFASGSEQTSSVIASYEKGIFLSSPSYCSRLSHLDNGKVALASVTSADAGTYTSEVVTKQTTASLSTTGRHLVVTVADPSVYRDKEFSLKMDDQAVADLQGEFHLRLTCGPLAWRGENAVDVIWTTPSGAEHNSTGYENDYFYLLLDNPPVHGVYACGLPTSAIPALCLQAGDPLIGKTTVPVDSITARLALLEANLQQVKEKNFHLTQRLQQIEGGRLQDVKGDNLSLTQPLQDIKGDNFNLTQQLQRLERENKNLMQQLQHVREHNLNLTDQLQQVRTEQDQYQVQVSSNTQRLQLLDQYRNNSLTHVGFHASMGRGSTISTPNPVKFLKVYYNDGSAYDNSTGKFTVPVNGMYFFVITTSTWVSETYGDCQLMVDRDTVARLYSKYSNYLNPSTGHAVLHLVKGSTVWVRSTKLGSLFYGDAIFSGFLIHPDW